MWGWRFSVGSVVALVCATALACGSFGTDDPATPPTEAGVEDARVGDAGTDGGGNTTPAPDGGFLGCDDYRSNDAGVKAQGTAISTAAGWTMTVSTGTYGLVQRTWTAPGFPIRKSIVTLSMDVFTASGVRAGEYANVFSQYYGASGTFDSTIPVNSATFVASGTKIDIWPMGGGDNRTPLSNTSATFDFNGDITVTTRWAEQGGVVDVERTGGTYISSSEHQTISGAAQSALTVEIGGYGNGGNYRYVLRGMCVTVEP